MKYVVQLYGQLGRAAQRCTFSNRSKRSKRKRRRNRSNPKDDESPCMKLSINSTGIADGASIQNHPDKYFPAMEAREVTHRSSSIYAVLKLKNTNRLAS